MQSFFEPLFAILLICLGIATVTAILMVFVYGLIKLINYLEDRYEKSEKKSGKKNRKRKSTGLLLDLKVWLELKLSKNRYVKVTDTRSINELGEELSFISKLKFYGIYPYVAVNYSISPRYKDDIEDVLYYICDNGVIEGFNYNNHYNSSLIYLIDSKKRMVFPEVKWEPYLPFQKKNKPKKIYPKFEMET